MLDCKKKPRQNGVRLSTITGKNAQCTVTSIRDKAKCVSLLHQGVQDHAYLITARNSGSTFRNSWPPWQNMTGSLHTGL